MSKEDFKEFKNYPEGSIEKRIYDSYFMDIDKYLIKYFKNNTDRFNSFYQDYITPVFEKNNRNDYNEFLQKKKPPFSIDYSRFDEFYNNNCLKNKILDVELFNFLSFLFSISHQFKNINVFMTWIENKIFLRNKTFNEIIKFPYGSNYIKSNLRELSVLNCSWV